MIYNQKYRGLSGTLSVPLIQRGCSAISGQRINALENTERLKYKFQVHITKVQSWTFNWPEALRLHLSTSRDPWIIKIWIPVWTAQIACVPSSVGSVLKLRPELHDCHPSVFRICGHNMCLNNGLLTHSQAESQGAGPCNIWGISIRRPAEPRSQTSPGGRQNLNHLFPWKSRGVRAQGYPECDRDELTTDVCLGPPRCFARGLELMRVEGVEGKFEDLPVLSSRPIQAKVLE